MCHAGWHGKACDEKCSNNTFGWSCQNRCHCANNSQCHHVSGKCPGGCTVGWEGPSCDKECSNNTFGWSCQNRCHCADNSQCHHVNGKCPGGCAVGWEGPSCDKECTNGTYGPGCNKTCHCLNEERCDASTGICSDGCSSGWEGDSCDIMVTVCSDGFYGINCSQRCGNCVDNTTCDHTTGNCSLGCAPGWKEHMCQSIACPEGFHGINCSKQCGQCAINTSCDPETGHCEEGCESGWLSLGCNKKCPDGLYGANCSFTCGHCSANQSCDHITGHCSSGCNLGWIGPLCQRTCETGHFGFNCSALCGHCSGNHSCHYETGECLLGCKIGWTGPFCINKYKGPKSFLESIIIPGAAAVLVLMIITVITAIVCRVRYRKKKLMQSNRKNYVDGHEMVYFIPDTEISDDSPYGGHAEATNEIRQTDYAEIHDVYEKLKGKRSTINFENFQEVYKHLLSVHRDGKTILFHAYQSLKTAEPVYSTVADKIGSSVNIANISYQELICQYQSLPRHGKGIHGQGSTHLLKFDGISYVVSDESLSSKPFWEAFERHSVYTCIHIGETNITRNTRTRFGNVLVQCTESTTTHSYTEQNLIFQTPETGSQINVTLLSSGVWEDYQEVPADPAWVVQIIEYMELNLKAKDIIMIHCRHSIDKAVMLSVMSGIYTKMKKTGSVDILGPTQTAWKLIPSCIGTYEQFKFLHDVALLAVKKYDRSS